ncbi:hypothetical protein ACF064_34605 [Streptomyces sp. NPDC015492]|uniref:hypothetical protein n=1 Tax=Streptomyces sp. NPDC015492 TaxID=3364958 RepID=UPI0036FC6E28
MSETRELSKILHGTSEWVIAYARSGEASAKAAGTVVEQARTTHAGIKEKFDRAPVDLTGVNRDWLRQE